MLLRPRNPLGYPAPIEHVWRELARTNSGCQPCGQLRQAIDSSHNDDIIVLDINRNTGAGNLCVDAATVLEMG